MAVTSHDMTAPRPEGSSAVYTVHGRPDPAAVTMRAIQATTTLAVIGPDLLATLETGDPALTAETLAALAAGDGETAVGAVGFDDWWNTALAALNPGWHLAAARRLVTDKAQLYRELRAHGVPVADFLAGPLSPGLLTDAMDRFGPRPILKPATGAGSRGVYRCRADLPAQTNLDLYQQHLQLGHIDSATTIIAAAYLGGEDALEISIDTIVCGGRTVTSTVHEKTTATTTHPYIDHLMISPPTNPRITSALPQLPDILAGIVATLDITDSALHAELRLHDRRWHVLDIGVRPGAGLVAHAALARTGIDPRAVHLAACIGHPPLASALAAARPQLHATVIACCYVSAAHRAQVQLSKLSALADALRTDPAVFGWHLNTAETSDEVYLSDGGLSIGVGDADPATALDRLRSLIEPHGFTTHPTKIVATQ